VSTASMPMRTASATRQGLTARLLPLSGAAFVVSVLASVVGLGGNTPDSDASAAKVMAFYSAHQDRQIVAAFVLAVAMPFAAIFAIDLALRLWPAGSERTPIWPIVLAGGGLLAGSAFAAAGFIHFALADGANTLSAGALQTLNVLDGDTWLVFNSSLGVMMLGAAGSLLPRQRVLGWSALVLGIALFIPFADFFALLLSGVWIVVVSVMEFRRAGVAAVA
jgi:hypothetical protein